MQHANREHAEQLKRKIDTLNHVQHAEIVKMLQVHKVRFSENTNGVFVNSMELPNEIVKQIEDYVNFCLNTKDANTKKSSRTKGE